MAAERAAAGYRGGMGPLVVALVAAGSVLWAAWVAVLVDRSIFFLLAVIWFEIGFGWFVGCWLGNATSALWTILGLGAISAVLAVLALASGTPGPGLPVLLGTIPALLAAAPAHAGGRMVERRRSRR